MKRQPVFAVAVCTLLAGVGGVASTPPVARAAIVADAASSDAVSSCGGFFSLPGNDPSGLWKRMNDPNSPVVNINYLPVPENGSGTRTRRPDDAGGAIVIFWDHTHPIVLDGLTSGPCEVLYHELQHAADDADGIPDSVLDEECNGINNAEWRAVAAQNALRKALGLPPRTTYHGKPFGSSSFDQCKKDQQSQPPPNKPGNGVFGDPHVTTTDGLIYDLQQVGEFTAFATDHPGTPRVQLRTAPVPNSALASMVTGAAAASGDQRIAFVLRDGRLTITHGPKNDPVAVDRGAQRDLGDGMMIASTNADANFVGSAYTVRWADGSEMNVDESGFWGLRVSFEPSEQAQGAAPRGLLGTFNGDPADDLTRPDGRQVPIDSPVATVRSQFGDAWRITQKDSLFPYGPGESTETFTDRSFPSAEPRFSDAVTGDARAVCRDAGVIGDAILAACVFDVAVTGNPALADTAAQMSRGTNVTTVAGEPLNGKGFGPGRAVSGSARTDQPVTYEFTAKAGEVANIRSACTPSARGFTYSVAPISGALAEPLGVVDGCTDLGRVAFGTEGTYRLVITGQGQYGIAWQATLGDVRRDLNRMTANAGHVSAGTRHYLRFIVAPGQKWTFIPDAACIQVSGFRWSVVDSSGALNDRGIDDGCSTIGPLTLTPGQYDVKIDAQGTDADYAFIASVG